MEKNEVVKLFNKYKENYDVDHYRQIWAEQSLIFQNFWNGKIFGEEDAIPETDYDPIIKLIDVKARGFNRATDEAIARVTLPQGTWYRIFNDLKSQKEIRTILDKIFKTGEESSRIDLVNQLDQANKKNKNGLSGEKAAALNALLFLNDPFTNLSCVSIADRLEVISAFGLSGEVPYNSYGEKVVLSNRDVIQGFKTTYGIDTWPRLLSNFLYSDLGLPLWKRFKAEAEEISLEVAENGTENEFALEKHLEDFLVANWESTELGKRYDLIEQDGELVSQQYPTKIGRIDLLVKEKKTGSYVVIELKKGQTSDDTIGQLSRYIGWVKEKMGIKTVKGIVIARLEDERLKYALKAIPDVEFFVYKVHFALEKR